MFRIGLTGGIGSGKSTVSAILKRLGAVIIDADQLARQVVEPDSPAWKEIVAAFGDDILLPDRNLNRKRLGEIIFADEKKRKLLESITHPAIGSAVEEELRQAEEQGAAVAVLDVPLLIESGWTNQVDEVWLVYVDPDLQEQRLMARNRLSKNEAQERIASQMNLRDKLQYANVIIDNNQDVETTTRQVRKAFDAIGTCVK